jgi:hypothetical protein
MNNSSYKNVENTFYTFYFNFQKHINDIFSVFTKKYVKYENDELDMYL